MSYTTIWLHGILDEHQLVVIGMVQLGVGIEDDRGGSRGRRGADRSVVEYQLVRDPILVPHSTEELDEEGQRMLRIDINTAEQRPLEFAR